MDAPIFLFIPVLYAPISDQDKGVSYLPGCLFSYVNDVATMPCYAIVVECVDFYLWVQNSFRAITIR